mmetsp:Transcript_63288/g.136057  ORF Transcript_63288/g.136057 Transcript_63288/m.136057 type:complete len:477 (+) Transcript_63288:76-1506(+)
MVIQTRLLSPLLREEGRCGWLAPTVMDAAWKDCSALACAPMATTTATCGTDPELGHQRADSREDHVPTLLHHRSVTADADAKVGNEEKGPMTSLEAYFSLINMILNYGIFSMPLVFLRSGMLAALLLPLVGCVCTYTAVLLGRVLEQMKAKGISRPNYGTTARAIAGPTFEALMHAACSAELVIYALGNLILLSRSLESLMPYLDHCHVIAACSVFAVILSAMPDVVFAYASLLSACSISIACATVVASGFDLPEWAGEVQVAGALEKLPVSLALITFNAAVHPVLPWIFNNTASREDYERAMWNGWLTWAMCGTFLGGTVYYMFGDAVQVVATQNIGRDLEMRHLPAAQGLVGFSAAWVVLKLQVSLVPITRPLTEALAEALGIKLPCGNGGVRCVLLSCPVFLALALATQALEHHLAILESLAGGVLMSLNAFIFPSLAYLLACRPRSLFAQAGASTAVAFGVALILLVTSGFL